MYDNSGTWTQVTGIVSYPTILSRLNEIGTCMVSIGDIDGSLYSTWSSRDFTKLQLRDDSDNVLFMGYLTGKKFHHDGLDLEISGVAKVLDWKKFHRNYILEEGKIWQIPSDESFPTDASLYPTSDVSTQWNCSGSNHYDELDQNSGYISATSGACTDEFATNNEAANLDNGTAIRIYLNGMKYRTSPEAYPANPTVDLYIEGGWKGEESVSIGSGSFDWGYAEFTGTFTEAEMDAMKFRIKHAGVSGTQAVIIKEAYCKVYYSGQDNTTVGLVDKDEEEFSWDTDYWINDQKVGILVVDNTNNIDYTTYDVSAISQAGGVEDGGNAASTQTQFDNNVYETHEAAGTKDMIISATLDGDNIDTGQYLQKIVVNYRIGHKAAVKNFHKVSLKIYNGSAYETIAYLRSLPASANTYKWLEGSYTIEGSNATLANYLTIDGANYDALAGDIKIYNESGSASPPENYICVDYLTVDIYHHANDIAPIMEEIDDSGDTWIGVTGENWTTNGVTKGDHFKIAQNTEQIISDVSNTVNVPIYIVNDSFGDKFIARHYKGTTCLDALKSVCMVEGAVWYEDYENECIVCVKPTDFEDSTVDLTQAEYNWDWEYDDQCNAIRRVDVYGCAGYNIHAFKEDIDSSSYIEKTIIDETIMTDADAQDVADAQFDLYDTKTPSIKLILKDVDTGCIVGQEVTITMVRPTVAEANYVVRMMERKKEGGSIITTIWAGLGHTEAMENIASKINQIGSYSHKAHTDRLVSTPLSSGASIVWSDIGGGTTAVEGIINTQLADGGTIDDRIDTLIDTVDYDEVSGNDDDTDVTATELETLTDGSNADALHSHSIDISDDTNLTAGTNITLVDDTLNVDDAFLVNDANDTTTGTITMAGLTLTANPSVISSANGIAIKPSGEADDYITISSDGDNITITVTGGGNIVFKDGNIVADGAEVVYDACWN